MASLESRTLPDYYDDDPPQQDYRSLPNNNYYQDFDSEEEADSLPLLKKPTRKTKVSKPIKKTATKPSRVRELAANDDYDHYAPSTVGSQSKTKRPRVLPYAAPVPKPRVRKPAVNTFSSDLDAKISDLIYDLVEQRAVLRKGKPKPRVKSQPVRDYSQDDLYDHSE